jgi:hypothetical protein
MSWTHILQDRTRGGEDTLGVLAGGLRLGVFCPMTQRAVLPVFDAWDDLPRGKSVTVQQIGRIIREI